MALPALKSIVLRNILIRALSFAVLIFAVRFAYLVTVKGGSCYSVDFCFLRVPGRVFSPSSSSSHTLMESARKSRKLFDYFSTVFQDLIAEGYLSPDAKTLCIDTRNGEDILALREIGVSDAIGISREDSPPLILSGEAHQQPFDDNSFDFVFSGNGGMDQTIHPVELGSEIGRTLKPGGFLVVHTKAKDLYSLHSLLDLFNCCKLIKEREIDGPDRTTIREIVMRKEMDGVSLKQRYSKSGNGDSGNKCCVPSYKRKIIRQAEPLIKREPRITIRRNIKNIKYLPSMVDISFKRKYIYIDVGARSYSSSIGSWFKEQYPRQNKTFEIYAIEGDKAFQEEYEAKKGITLLPYTAWVRNETLFFEITRNARRQNREGEKKERIQKVESSMSFISETEKIEGFDFAKWLKSCFSAKDFVVVKMDVEGIEFQLIESMMETGAICLVDELILECHYSGLLGSNKFGKAYAQCLKLFKSVRKSGVLVHQWW
ncbi:uncharacterized protein LOC110823689 [Carica papaya]|uniref:uncharacterized protein LOC110823689 n=1 Tax=Carica papaya TaxID=3649 RepID=UPI000B8CB8B4|nr:uncharacterized protein LOC110823689 [Carica papaya]